MEEQWYTVKDACEYLKVSQMTIFRWMKSGKLTHFKMGGSVRFTQENLDQVAKKKTGKSEATQAIEKCSICGNSELIPGKLQGMSRMYFKPDKTKFLVMSESLIPLTSKMCSVCGNIQLSGDTEKMSKLNPNQE